MPVMGVDFCRTTSRTSSVPVPLIVLFFRGALVYAFAGSTFFKDEKGYDFLKDCVSVIKFEVCRKVNHNGNYARDISLWKHFILFSDSACQTAKIGIKD